MSGANRPSRLNPTATLLDLGRVVGALGDGTADDTARFVAALAAGQVALVLPDAYRLDNLEVTDAELRGEHRNVLRAVDTSPILFLRGGSTLRNVTIDGEGEVSRRVDVGDTGDENIIVQDVTILDCATNSFRIREDTNGFRMINMWADNSKIFNTEDDSDPSNMLFSNMISVRPPREPFLIDLPGANPDWTGFLIADSLWELSADSKRAIGIARAYGGLVIGQVIRGHLSDDDTLTSDLIHYEDKAQLIATVGNVFETNGSYHAIDGSLGGDETYPQDDRSPKELLFTANLYKATDTDTDTLIWLEGSTSSDEIYDAITVVGETLLCNGFATPLQTVARSGVFGRNHIYEAPAPEYVRSLEVSTGNSKYGPHIIRLPSHHVEPTFMRGDSGHGYNPENVLFRTSFGFATYSNFQNWAASIKTITGAAVATFAGTVAGGSASFVTDFAVTVTVGSGTFTLTVNGNVTSGIAFNALGSAVKSAIETADPTVTATVTGTAPNFVITMPAATTLTGTGATVDRSTTLAKGGAYLRATRGASPFTLRMILEWDVRDIDLQQLDNICARVMTRSSIQSAGKISVDFPSAGPSTFTRVFNDGSDFASWKTDGVSSVLPSTANLFATNAGTVRLTFHWGDSLATTGDTCDWGVLAVSHTRATPF